jgi:23S rRNA pseudouridine2605 synthase
MEQETLLKLLVVSGLGSRRQMADVIRQGRIKVNGEVVENFSYQVNRIKDTILIDGKPVQTKPKPKIVLMLNKPVGVLSTTHDDRGRKTIIDILPQKYRNMVLYPIGRLDKDSTGLLLVTNDGELTYQLTHPKFEHEKEYIVAIKGKLRADEISSIERGIHLDDGVTSRAAITETMAYPPYNYSITIHEGRNRQIHRMLAKLGHAVLALKRVRVGRLKLGNLQEGAIHELSSPEIARLLQA